MAGVSMMSALAIDMLLPAFGDMRPDFGLAEDSTQLSLTITLFFLGSAVGYLIYGPLSDALGRKRVLAISLGLYALCAVVATLSNSLTMLLAARFVWGFAAAGPRVLSQSIVRDRYSGTAMARVMTLIQAAFFLGPILAPIIGQGLVTVGSWRWVTAFGVFSAAAILAWSTRLEETLPLEHRRTMQPAEILRGFIHVSRNRTTMLYGFAIMFGFGAFYSFLASSELIFDSIFGRENLFVAFFVATSMAFSLVAVLMNWALRRTEAHVVALAAGGAYATFSIAMLVVIAIGDGRPDFWIWVVLFAAANACQIAFFPSANSLALEPMGELAGTATGILGFVTATVGAALGNQIDRRIDDTLWAIGIGYALYACAALALQLLARRHRLAQADI